MSLERGAVSWYEDSKDISGESDPLVNICPNAHSPVVLTQQSRLCFGHYCLSDVLYFLLCIILYDRGKLGFSLPDSRYLLGQWHA